MVVPFLVLGVTIFLAGGYITFFTAKYESGTRGQIFFFIGVALFIYFSFSPVRKLIRNEPIVILDRDSITLNTSGTVTIRRNEIEHIEVVYVDETGYFLNIKTKSTTHKTNISWLEKTPDEIKDLIKSYAG